VLRLPQQAAGIVLPQQSTGSATFPAQDRPIGGFSFVIARWRKQSQLLMVCGGGSGSSGQSKFGKVELLGTREMGDSAMNQTKLGRRAKRIIRDFVVGLVLFLVIAVSGAIERGGGADWVAGTAHAGFFHLEPHDSVRHGFEAIGAPVKAHQRLMTLFSMALAFASMFALNLWFVRHVRRLHASYLRRHER
jgi:hypothetical protein